MFKAGFKPGRSSEKTDCQNIKRPVYYLQHGNAKVSGYQQKPGKKVRRGGR